MLFDFFFAVREAGVPVSVKEHLTLLEALDKGVVFGSIDDFYVLARACLVKDEAQYDRYDLAFASYFNGVAAIFDLQGAIPDDWLKREFEKLLSDEDKKKVAALGGLDELIEAFKKRLEEQKGRHAGGSKWIGTGGTSPFGAYGFNPEGIRAGGESGQRRAVKIWDERNFSNLDGDVELNTRNIKVALRKLRRFAREGVPEELDLDGTIRGTARSAGWLDLKLQPERRNRVKVLLLLDVGGSMYSHVQVCEELFSAAKSEFRHLETFYFHNCVYDFLWRDNTWRRNHRLPTWDLLRTYGPDWRLVIVGDAAMSPYELIEPGGGIDESNAEAGIVWLRRLTEHYKKSIWWNPEPARAWEYTRSTQLIQQAIGPRMHPLTLDGIARGIDALRR